MKKVCVLVIVGLIACYAHALTLPSGEQVDDLLVKYVYRYPDGSLRSCNFTKPFKIRTPAGKLTVKGYVRWYENGVISACRLQEPCEIGTPVGKLTVRGIEWYGSGTLKACSLDGEVKINTPVGELSPSEYISWHENRALQSCNPIPAVEVSTPSGTLKIYGAIFWYYDGDFMGGILAEDATIEGTPYKDGNWVAWDKQGTFRGPMEYDWQTGEWSETE
jgi:hypothetical protein